MGFIIIALNWRVARLDAPSLQEGDQERDTYVRTLGLSAIEF